MKMFKSLRNFATTIEGNTYEFVRGQLYHPDLVNKIDDKSKFEKTGVDVPVAGKKVVAPSAPITAATQSPNIPKPILDSDVNKPKVAEITEAEQKALENGTKHIVTEEDLKNNPELVDEGVKVGDEIILPKPIEVSDEVKAEAEKALAEKAVI